MSLLRAVVVLLSAALAVGALGAEEWRTVGGERWTGKLSGVYGALAVFSDKDGSRQVPVDTLDAAALERVADFVAKPAPAVTWSASTSPVAKALKGRLQQLRAGDLVAFDPGARPEPEVYLVYFGAKWCGPCVQFSPKLAFAYQIFKKAVGDRVEAIFVSNDRDSDEQHDYVLHVGMRWPVLKFSSVGRVPVLERWANRGIPCLVAVNPAGDVIYHTYRGDEYLGPAHVLERVHELTAAMRGESDDVRRGLHPLAVVQHRRAAAGGQAPPKPYAISLDRSRYRTLDAKELLAELELDAGGRVVGSHFEPKPEAVIEYQLTQDAQRWLFLPAVEGGVAVGRRVQLPLKL